MYQILINEKWTDVEEKNIQHGQKYRFTHTSGATRVSYYYRPDVIENPISE